MEEKKESASAPLKEDYSAFSDPIEGIKAYLEREKGLSLDKIIGTPKGPKGAYSFHQTKKLDFYFKGLNRAMILGQEKLPPVDQWAFEQETEKIRSLNAWLLDKEKLSLSQAIGLSPKKMERYLSGERIPSTRTVKMIADYFFLDVRALTDDALALPQAAELRVNEAIASAQRDDYAAQSKKNENRHVVRRNWWLLPLRKRVRVLLSCLLLTLPLLAFTAYCATVEGESRLSDETALAQQTKETPESKQIAAEILDAPLDEYRCQTPIAMGSEVHAITNITATSFEIKMSVWFNFEQRAFHKTLGALNSVVASYSAKLEKEKALGELPINYADQDYLRYQTTTGAFTLSPDGIPDFIQADYSLPAMAGAIKSGDHLTMLKEAKLSPVYTIETSSYPSNTTSNMYPNSLNMWSINGASFVADTYTIDEATAYRTDEVAGDLSTTLAGFYVFSKATFSATIYKKFACPRYPLDSATFLVDIAPSFGLDFFQYVPTSTVSLRSEVKEGRFYQKTLYGTADPQEYTTGVGDPLTIANGYVLIGALENNPKAYVQYRGEKNADGVTHDLSTVYGDYQFVIEVNRQGLSLFLQAFANLFAVIVWISIAFYDQSHNNADSIGMLGTGLFGAISSVLVGISMLNDANIFSLITMIDIFTLAVIMLMTFLAVMGKRALIKDDKLAIAYNTIKFRILFVVLLLCTAMMFIGLPLVAYIFL
jgi:hypothetical protein